MLVLYPVYYLSGPNVICQPLPQKAQKSTHQYNLPYKILYKINPILMQHSKIFSVDLAF